MTGLLSISVSLLPVLAFLAGLVYLDSFKLVRPGTGRSGSIGTLSSYHTHILKGMKPQPE